MRFFDGRGDWIRTSGLYVPNVALYQAEPHLERSAPDPEPWLRKKDSNPHIQSQSLLCYLYTIPQHLLCDSKDYYIKLRGFVNPQKSIPRKKSCLTIFLQPEMVYCSRKGVRKFMSDTLAAYLEQAVREEGEIRGAVFSGETLEHSRAEGVGFHACRFENCRLPFLSAEGAFFEDCTFLNCDFSNASLPDCCFRRTRLSRCRLLGASLGGAVFDTAEFLGCSCRLASFSSARLRHTVFSGCDLSECEFQECELKSAAFTGCKMRKSCFLHTPLQGVDLRGNETDGLSVAGPELRGAVVSPAQACELSRYLGLIIR